MTSNKKKTILVVDDDETHLYTTRELLQSEEIAVVTHKNAFGVTSLVRDLKPNLVLLDINMPALSGDKLSSLITPYAETAGIPVLFYSSNDEESIKKSVAQYGAWDYVCKGDLADLRSKVVRYLGSPTRKTGQ